MLNIRYEPLLFPRYNIGITYHKIYQEEPDYYYTMKFVISTPIIIIFLIFQVTGSDHPVYVSDSDIFRPVYSFSQSGMVSPDQSLLINVDIRDSDTGFVRVYAWGDNETDWNLKGDTRTEQFIVPCPSSENTTGYPKVLTIRNLTNEYLVLDPGLYSMIFESNESSGKADILVTYVYHEQIDMGIIKNQTHSVWETNIPPGLERIIFMTESTFGTDLNLYVQKGNRIPSSFSEFEYNSTSNCSTCWDPGVENYLAEIMAVDKPDSGPYLMVTKADGGDDFFYSYWIGIEKKED